MDSPDILRLVFDQLAGDYDSLCAVGLTCQAWRSLSLPALLAVVDVSSHNNGRMPEHECEMFPEVYGDYSAHFVQENLLSRQHAFLRLILDRPEIAKYVKSFTWTLIWDHDCGAEIDRRTWEVFSLLQNVTALDLASLHVTDCYDLYIRKNPDQLFPAVVHLRLVGWMHRGLVKAIVTSLDSRRLRRLELDNLLDEGCLPDGSPLLPADAEPYMPTVENSTSSQGINDDLFQRQEKGEACIFVGPMWWALRYLAAQPSLTQLSHLEVGLEPLNYHLDLRSYHSLFEDTGNLIRSARGSLESLTIIFREGQQLYKETMRLSLCGTGRMYQLRALPGHRMRCIRMASTFLSKVLDAVNEANCPKLKTIRCEGFNFLEEITAQERYDFPLTKLYASMQACVVDDASFTEIRRVDYRVPFYGWPCEAPKVEGLDAILARS